MKQRRLKIGIFLDNYYPSIDGVIVVVDNLCKELSKFNDVTLVVPYTISMSEDKSRGYEVKRIRSFKIPFSEYRLSEIKPKYSRAYKYLLSKKFDIIHIHSPFAVGNLGVRIAKDLHIPVICTMHTRYDFEIRKRIDSELIIKSIIKEMMKVFNKCDGGIAINNAMKKVFRDFGCTLKPTVIYNGTDLKGITNKEVACDIVNKKYDLKSDETVFLFVGRLIEIKNIFFILDALKLLKEEGYKFKMMYVGYGPDERELKHRIKEYDMNNDVILTGKITDRNLLSSIYARADLFLFPSLFDASSLVQIEAAVNKTPGLFIKGSVTSDTVINNKSGFTSDNSVIAYKDRIKEIMGNKKLLNEVSENAKKMLGKSWESISIETYNYYLKVIKKYNSWFYKTNNH